MAEIDFPNPEARWRSAEPIRDVDRAEVESRIGTTHQAIELLAGGLANRNLRIGPDRVLRIYRRAPEELPKERTLLARRWTHLRVPEVLAEGIDFLLLEYVEHRTLRGSYGEGWAIGTALAEIHSTSFNEAGFLGPEATVVRPFSDIAESFGNYLEAQFADLDADWRELRGPTLKAFHNAMSSQGEGLNSPVLLHGDFKVSNLHWTLAEKPLVLDWEFAYSGPALMDIGQLFRWRPPQTFRAGFVRGYEESGGILPTGWQRLGEALDLINLVGLLGSSRKDERREADLRLRIREIVA